MLSARGRPRGRSPHVGVDGGWGVRPTNEPSETCPFPLAYEHIPGERVISAS